MKTSSASSSRHIAIALAVALILLLAGRATAFDFADVASAPPAVKACMEELLSEKGIEAVRSGKKPKDRNVRKKIKKAYSSCLSASADGDTFRYDGPLFDAMSQIDETVKVNQAMEGVREAGVSKLVLFARSRKRLHQNEDLVQKLAKRNPDLIVLGAPKYFQLSGDVTDAYIKATVSGIKNYDYKVVGELLYTHGDKASGKQYSSGERYVDPSRPGTAKLLTALVPLKIPFMAHWEPYAPERDFPKFHKLYSDWPDQVFLLPHMGFASAEVVDEFMSQHPNLYCLTSKKERYMGDFASKEKQDSIGSPMLSGNTLRPEWKALLIKFQDRILFATDPHMKKLWMKYGEVVERQRLVLGQLPREAAEKIAYRNAEKVYGVKITD